MSKGIFVIAMFICLLFPSNTANAATFNVGDASGWGFGVNTWPNGKSFKAGDVLVFRYTPGMHSVVAVNQANFDACTASGTTFTSGNDQITLTKGVNHFICGFPGHCSSFGMKIAITAN